MESQIPTDEPQENPLVQILKDGQQELTELLAKAEAVLADNDDQPDADDSVPVTT